MLKAGRVTAIGSEGGVVLDDFLYHPTPGHCLGHMSIGFASGGEHGLFAGDVMHHPIQVAWPDWSSVFSEDPTPGRASPLWALNHAADTGALVFSAHFPGTGAGRVVRTANGFGWSFA